MTFPPPPPGPPQYSPQPPLTGPGGAYGPAPVVPGQPVPGRAAPAAMTMPKPGSVTGIQVIMWIFLAIGAVGDLFSVVNLVNHFHPLGLLALAYALYTTVQALVTPIHLSRGKRWAWIWSLVTAIIGLVFAAAAIVFGIAMIDLSPVTLIVGVVFGGLHGTLLGLLCTASARRWILMHRVGHDQAPMPAAPAGLGAAPEPLTHRPASATFTLVVLGLLVAACMWLAFRLFEGLRVAGDILGLSDSMIASPDAMLNTTVPLLVATVAALLAIGTALGVMTGKAGGRVFGIVWTSVLTPVALLVVIWGTLIYLDYRDLLPPGHGGPWVLTLTLKYVLLALIITVFVCLLLPGVRAWTGGRPRAAAAMAVPYPPPGHPQPQYPPQGYGPGPY